MLKIAIVLLFALVACSQARPESAANSPQAVLASGSLTECLAGFRKEGQQTYKNTWEFIGMAVKTGTSIPLRYIKCGTETNIIKCGVEALQGTVQDAADIATSAVVLANEWSDLIFSIIIKCFVSSKKVQFLEAVLGH